MKKKQNNRFQKKEDKHRINEKIIGLSEVRLVGDGVEPGIYPIQEARNISEDLGMDLVEISPKAEPPVCKIIDYRKFLYDQAKNVKKPVKTVTKELRFTPNTDDHDFAFKVKHAINFLEKGNKVKAFVFFRGREMQHKDRGEMLLLNLAQEVEACGIPESLPKLEGKRMIMWIKPIKK